MARRTEQEFRKELTELLIEEGISKLTIAEIAERLSCSRRRLYQIASTKEELFLTVCKSVFDKSLQIGHAKASIETDSIKEINAYLQATLKTSGMKPACFLDLESTEEGRQIFDNYQLARVRGLEEIIQRGIKQNVFHNLNPRLVSEAILGAAFRLRKQEFLVDVDMSISEAFGQLYNIILNGLLRKN